LMITMRISLAMARSIFRKFSDCCSSWVARVILLILVRPSTRSAISGPNNSLISSRVAKVSSTVSWRRPAATVAMSILMSARMAATSRGWMR